MSKMIASIRDILDALDGAGIIVTGDDKDINAALFGFLTDEWTLDTCLAEVPCPSPTEVSDNESES